MILSAILVSVMEREFLKAVIWTAVASGLSMIGLIHAYNLVPSGVQNRRGGGGTGTRPHVRAEQPVPINTASARQSSSFLAACING